MKIVKQSSWLIGIASSLTLLAMTTLHAQTSQFYLEDTIREGLKTRIYVIGEAQAKTQVQQSLYAAVDHARGTLTKIQKELEEINLKKTKGHFLVGPELAQAVQSGLEISKKTSGLFNIAGDASFKKIKVNTKNNSLKIGEENLQIDLSALQNGFLADLIAQDLVQAGWRNCLVKIGNVYVTRGGDINAPWRIPVVVPSDKIAKRVLYYQTKQEEAAGATWTEAQPSEGLYLKSVTIFSNSGANSEGLASTVFKMGMEEGKKFLARNKSLSGILIDNQGNLVNVP